MKNNKKSRLMIKHYVLAELNNHNNPNYLNVLVKRSRKRPGRLMVEQLSNKQSVLADYLG